MSSIQVPIERRPRTSGVVALRRKLDQWFEHGNVSESAIVMSTALVVGIGSGLGAVLFRRLIKAVQTISFDGLGGLLSGIAPFHLIIIPALGGLIFGPMIYRFAREAKGHGVPEVMEAVSLRGGRIRPQVAVVKALASSICIGTGGSVGREGPIAQIGSALGSTLGQLLNLSDERIRNLVACGAAGGVAATFNAPIAAAIFALEVILGRFHAVYFGAVVISAVTADVIAHFFEGNMRAFAVPEYVLVSPWELALYTLLGILAAAASAGFTRLLYFSEDIWDTFRFPEYLKPVVGGVFLGIIGVLTFKVDGFPRVFGVGYETISETLFGHLALQVTFGLLFIKMIATVLTLGSGGSGGIFAPSLFMGAMLGGTFGQVANRLLPNITAPSGAYALVGMAAFFAGAAHAPITAILILFEMTGNYSIILPLMLATVMSTFISRMISQDSVYTLKLSRRGVHLQQGQDVDVMQGVMVSEAMTEDVDTVTMGMPLDELVEEFDRTHHHGFPVVDDEGLLAGVVSIRELESAVDRGPIAGKTVADIATTEDILVTYPDEPMWRALRRMGTRDVSRLPVVEEEGSRVIVGLLRRRDIIRAYQRAIIQRANHQHRAETLRLDKIDGGTFEHIDIPPESPVVGRRIKDVHLSDECLIVSLRRGRKLHVAHGNTVLQSGDKVTIFADRECISTVGRVLRGEASEPPPADLRSPRYREFKIPAGATNVGKMVRDLPLPPNSILVAIQRDNRTIVPHGDTVLQPGDVIEVFGTPSDLDETQANLSS